MQRTPQREGRRAYPVHWLHHVCIDFLGWLSLLVKFLETSDEASALLQRN